MRLAAFFLLIAAAAWGEDYQGPRPPKPDVPYLQQVDKLTPTEESEAAETKKKNDVVYTIRGESSAVKTPLSGPVFLFEYSKLNPRSLELYRLETRNGNREITINSKKRGPQPLRIEVTRIAEKLYRIEVKDSLANGEYSFSPTDSNRVFCFGVF